MTPRKTMVRLRDTDYPFWYLPGGNIREALRKVFSGEEYPPLWYLPHARIETIADVGAHQGAASLWFHSQYPTARILSFEPLPDNVALLERNTRDIAAITVHPFGLSAGDGEGPMFTGRAQTMQASLYPSSESGRVRRTVRVRDARTVLRESGLEHLSILKVDTEGSEVPILERVLPDWGDRIGALYLEWHTEEDRLTFDAMLRDRFLVVSMRATEPHRGSVCYLAKCWADAVPGFHAHAVRRPLPAHRS